MIDVRAKRFSISRNRALGNAKSLIGESFEDIFQINPILPNIKLRCVTIHLFFSYYIFFDYEQDKSKVNYIDPFYIVFV